MNKELLNKGDLTNEQERDYMVIDTSGKVILHFGIKHPVAVYYGPGHAFHRVYDGEKPSYARYLA